MTSREAFETWMRHIHPSVSLEFSFNGEVGFYVDVWAQIRWQAWQESKLHNTTGAGKFVKTARTDKPGTLVNRLRGIYGTAVEPYKMTELHYEAAREIERLRGELNGRV